MTSEPHRLQYLDAMGLTAWVSKYQLPNALPSEVCDWPELERREKGAPAADSVAPRERFQALLASEDASSPAAASDAGASQATPPVRTAPGEHARALLEGLTPGGVEAGQPGQASSGAVSASRDQQSHQAEPRAEQAHWEFRLQVGCVAGRWLVIVPSDHALSDLQSRLLGNLFAAAGVVLDQPPGLEAYRWPPFQGGYLEVASHDPAQEARDGLSAFVSGRQRMGWHPRQLLVFGMNDRLRQLLAIESEHSAALDLPVWVGPELQALSVSAEEKRALWPRLAGWKAAADD